MAETELDLGNWKTLTQCDGIARDGLRPEWAAPLALSADGQHPAIMAGIRSSQLS